jgi:hypothetical protein
MADDSMNLILFLNKHRSITTKLCLIYMWLSGDAKIYCDGLILGFKCVVYIAEKCENKLHVCEYMCEILCLNMETQSTMCVCATKAPKTKENYLELTTDSSVVWLD